MDPSKCKSGYRYTFICDKKTNFRATFIDILYNENVNTLRTCKTTHIKEGMLACPANWIKTVETINSYVDIKKIIFTLEILELIDQYI